MSVKQRVPAQYIQECFTCDESTGELFWKTRPDSHFKSLNRSRAEAGARAGAPAGRRHSITGYLIVTLHYQGVRHTLSVHRIIWVLVTGDWPKDCIDHINGIRHDNRPANLRDVTHAENMRNLHGRVRPLPGAYPSRHRFRSQITRQGKSVSLGSFATAEEAHQAYLAARDSLRSTSQPTPEI